MIFLSTLPAPQTRHHPIIAARASNRLVCNFNQSHLAGVPECIQTSPYAYQQLCAEYKSKSCIIEEPSEDGYNQTHWSAVTVDSQNLKEGKPLKRLYI